MGKPSPHGALGIDGGAPAPPLELLPPEPPLDAELLVSLPVVVLGDAPVSLQYVGSWGAGLTCRGSRHLRRSGHSPQ